MFAKLLALLSACFCEGEGGFCSAPIVRGYV